MPSPPCPVPAETCEARAALYRRMMAQRDVLEALVLRLERYEWPQPELVQRARDLLTYPPQ
jgi:hypothetical protein